MPRPRSGRLFALFRWSIAWSDSAGTYSTSRNRRRRVVRSGTAWRDAPLPKGLRMSHGHRAVATAIRPATRDGRRFRLDRPAAGRPLQLPAKRLGRPLRHHIRPRPPLSSATSNHRDALDHGVQRAAVRLPAASSQPWHAATEPQYQTGPPGHCVRPHRRAQTLPKCDRSPHQRGRGRT